MATESGLGVQTLLRSGTSPSAPMSFAETPGGLLLLANGVDPVLRWDGFAQVMTPAGVTPPSSAPELGGIGLGMITGKLVAYQRFIDAYGNVSDLSPVSNLMDAGRDGFVQDVNYDAFTGLVTIRSAGHGLFAGDQVIILGSLGLPLLDGAWTIQPVDDDSFTIDGLSITSGAYEGGGYWTSGVLTVAYGAVQIPASPTVSRRQILRNLAGNVDTLYVDVDTTDLLSTAFTSQKVDADLARGIAVPLTYGEGDLPYANRHGVPPSHKAVITSHKGRIFAAADSVYTSGHAEVDFGTATVQGVGTDWRPTFVGRRIYFEGSTAPYGIAAVNPSLQQITLDRPFQDAPRAYVRYTIRPEAGERRLVYYSEPGLPESWPAYNALAIPEANDEIVGLLSLGQYLYVVERRHIHRITTQGDPQEGYTFLSATRGSINARTFATADSVTYFLDEIGIHRFDGQDSQAISQPVQSVFHRDGLGEYEVDWDADQSLWHAAQDPIRDTIRWFVNMAGRSGLRFAICFNYRTERWWLEEYPVPMTASTNATLGARRSLVGTEARRVLCLSEGSYDGVKDIGTLRGTATDATSTTIEDTSASFLASEGTPITIVEGTGRDQTRIIALATDTEIEVVEPWDVTPDETSVYQIGGIPWRWRSGWFRFIDAEEDGARDVEIVFAPTSKATTLDFSLYFDHSTTPREWARDIDQDGVRTAAGDHRITVDLDSGIGWARQRIGGHAGTYSHGDTFVSVAMSGVQGGAPVRVSQVVLNDVEGG